MQAGDRLRAMGSEIAALEARKRAAVEQEDYDTAKALKGQIERMRAAGRQMAYTFSWLLEATYHQMLWCILMLQVTT